MQCRRNSRYYITIFAIHTAPKTKRPPLCVRAVEVSVCTTICALCYDTLIISPLTCSNLHILSHCRSRINDTSRGDWNKSGCRQSTETANCRSYADYAMHFASVTPGSSTRKNNLTPVKMIENDIKILRLNGGNIFTQ